MIKARFIKHTLVFKSPSATSRGILTTKDSWFLILKEKGKIGIGECSILKGLSYDDHPDFEAKIDLFCNQINTGQALLDLTPWPAIKMGYETALLSIKSSTPHTLFPSLYTQAKDSIPINGLVWMGSFDYMKEQIDSLLDREFDCIKIKIGAIDFNEELRLLAQLRNRYDSKTITIRVDANGAFAAEDALNKLDQLNAYEIDSIEQPIAINQWEHMSTLCRKSPIPIALDEELIGVFDPEIQSELLTQIKPQYLIFKPSLLGGFSNTQKWIDLAKKHNIAWWITSALESNVGLNAIAQWTYSKNPFMPQGLGTGSLFLNNIDSPLVIKKGCLWNDNAISWKKFF
tara:strand:- start:77 stop:1108 length:1032 start_codon:yes stop_codon:yes gene_type:complete